MTNYGDILRNQGYKLIDRGNYWQTSAIFREGDNPTAISIYKNSGVWTDFANGKTPLPFELLLKKTLKTNDVKNLLKESSFNSYQHRKEFLKQEKTFSDEALKKLLPHYDYFENKDSGINKKIQKLYKCGLATNGKLYQRIVFPIYREDGKIHGFSGRKVIEEADRPKWLHYGKSADWFYPYFTVDDVKEQVEDENRIFSVESIGDSMALYQAGVRNNCVSFTNIIQPRMLSRLSAMGVDIVLCPNNDEGQNRGFDGALSSLLKLLDLTDLNKIYFHPPKEKVDFGQMTTDQIREWRKGFDTKSHKEMCQELLNYAPKAKIAKGLRDKVKKFKKEFELLYEGD